MTFNESLEGADRLFGQAMDALRYALNVLGDPAIDDIRQLINDAYKDGRINARQMSTMQRAIHVQHIDRIAEIIKQ